MRLSEFLAGLGQGGAKRAATRRGRAESAVFVMTGTHLAPRGPS
jgi:hypothetical protein